MVPVTGIVSWLAGTRSRRNSAIASMQTTIDLLAEQNLDLFKQMLELRDENAQLKIEGAKRDTEISELKHQIEKLSKP